MCGVVERRVAGVAVFLCSDDEQGNGEMTKRKSSSTTSIHDNLFFFHAFGFNSRRMIHQNRLYTSHVCSSDVRPSSPRALLIVARRGFRV